MTAVTIYDVAALAGVSIKSVSRVLNDEPNVSQTLKDKVQKAVHQLGYRRSLSARSLAGASSYLIAAFVDAELTIEHWKSGRGNDYLSRLELGALMECRRADYHLMVELIDHGSDTLERDVTALLAALKPAGVLLTPPNSDHPQVLAVLERTGTPFARIGPEATSARGFSISMDERQAAQEMTEHLIGLGHRRIGFISGPANYSASRKRRGGFEAAMAAHDLPVADELMVEGDFTFESGVAGGGRLLGLDDRPTAIFASNDDMALGVLQAAAALGLKAPDDVSVAGYDDTPSALFSTPPLTTVRQPVAEMAARATRLLIPALKPEDASEASIVPYELILRASTAPLAA
ncbi:MAG: LacI family DNA-binding transcriptional regulator [Caulobacter sp.]|nr:LacI family DNA-binding transcriptional regulator [Caulobacter sp.]